MKLEKPGKKLQTLCLVSPTVGFDEYSQAYAQVVTRETVTETSILEEIQENFMTHCEEANKEGHDDSKQAPLPPFTKEALDMVKQPQLYVMCHKTNGEDFSGVLHKMNSYLMKQFLHNKKKSTVLNNPGQK